MILFAIASVVAGFVVGILSGLLGIGGGTILVSIFSLIYGMGALQSTATSLFTIIPTSLSGAITHIRNRTCVVGVGIAAGIGGACMSPVGVWLASISPEWLVLLAAALVIAYSAITMFRKAFKLRAKQRAEAALEGGEAVDAPTAADAKAADVSQAPDAEAANVPQAAGGPEAVEATAASEAAAPAVVLSEFKLTRKMALQSAGIGLGAGLLSGYVGVGGGFLMVPMFMGIIGLPMKLTSGSSLIAVMILAIPGTITQALLGNIDWLVGISVAIGSIPGAIIGARLMKRIPELALRFFFGGFLLVIAVLLAVNQFI